MYAGREQQRGCQLDGKARAGGRGQCRRASGERWLLGGRGGGHMQHREEGEEGKWSFRVEDLEDGTAVSDGGGRVG